MVNSNGDAHGRAADETRRTARRLSMGIALVVATTVVVWVAWGPGSQRKPPSPEMVGRETATRAESTAPDGPRRSLAGLRDEAGPGEIGGSFGSMILHAVDAAGQAVGGARVLLPGPRGGDRRLGTTGPNGIVRIASPDAAGEEVALLHDDYATAWERLPDPLAGERTVVLAAASEIRGDVVETGSGAPIADARVVAVRRGRSVSAVIERSFAGGRTEITADTGADGSFVLRGCDPSFEYRLYACSPCRYPWSGVPRVRPGAGRVRIELAPLYGTVVQIREADGSFPRASPELFSRPVSFSWGLPRGVEIREAPYDFVAAKCAGLPDDVPAIGDSRYDALFLLMAASGAEKVGPIDITCAVPGYETVEFEVWARPCEREGLSTVTIPIRPVAQEWGALLLACTGGLTDDPAVRCSSSPVGIVELIGPKGSSFEVGLDAYTSEPQVIEGVPAGVYSLRFHSAPGTFHYPDADRGEPEVWVEVRPEVAAEFVIDLSNMACVQLVFPEEAFAAGSLEGGLTVSLHENYYDEGFVPLYLDPDCLVVPGLSPRAYRFETRRPTRATSGEWAVLSPGVVTVLEMR